MATSVAELVATLGLATDAASFEKGNKALEGLHHAVEAYIGVESIKQLGEMINGTVEAAVSAKHMGEQLGISAEAVQELGYAADVTGASAEDMQVAMQRFSRGLEEAHRTGTGPMVDALAKLHVSFANLQGATLDQNLEVLADRFSQMPDGAEKAALAMELFGRSGARLIPFLNKGQAGIVALREEAQKLGIVMDESAIAKSEEFEIAQKKLAATLTGLRNEAVVSLLPALQDMAEGLMGWVQANRAAIVSTLESVLKGIAAAFRVVGSAVQAVTELFMDHKGVVVATLETLGIAMGVFAAEAAADWLLALGPIDLLIPAIAGLILLVQNFGSVWSWVKDEAGSAWDWIENKATDFIDWFESLPGKFVGWLSDISDSIKGYFADAWASIVNGAKEAWHQIEDLPIIGRFVKAGEWIGGKLTSGPSVDVTPTPSTPLGYGAAMFGGGGPETINHTFGDTNITVNATGVDEERVGEMVGDAVLAKQQEMIRQSYNTLKGGKR